MMNDENAGIPIVIWQKMDTYIWGLGLEYNDGRPASVSLGDEKRKEGMDGEWKE